MKSINLISISEALENLDNNILNKYLEYFGIDKIKENEKKDLMIFTKLLQEYSENINFFEGYFFGFIIPQIGSEEFDLLRFGKNFNLNIEFKSQNDGEEKIKIQLIRKKYFLKFLENTQNYNFTFISNKKKLYYLNNTNNLEEVNFEMLVDLIKKQELLNIENIDNLFNPSNYLVSPFNSTDKFINGEYFLTKQQGDFKKEIIKKIKKGDELFIGITGAAGTGKTLLTYDIAKYFIDKNYNILIVHSGNLNEGHLILKEKCKWDIIPIREFYNILLNNEYISKYDLIIIDEAQRSKINLYKLVLESIKYVKYILSYDTKQILRNGEGGLLDEINNKYNVQEYRLSKKIRTNIELASFIKGFFEKNRTITAYYNKKNIGVSYFKRIDEAQGYISLLVQNNFKFIEYTPSNILPHTKFQEKCPIYNINLGYNNDNAHSVIGQEFDNIVVIVDHIFYYNEEGKLKARYPRPYYLPEKMLFQIMTRVRKKLHIVIINNKEILNRCLELLK